MAPLRKGKLAVAAIKMELEKQFGNVKLVLMQTAGNVSFGWKVTVISGLQHGRIEVRLLVRDCTTIGYRKVVFVY